MRGVRGALTPRNAADRTVRAVCVVSAVSVSVAPARRSSRRVYPPRRCGQRVERNLVNIAYDTYTIYIRSTAWHSLGTDDVSSLHVTRTACCYDPFCVALPIREQRKRRTVIVMLGLDRPAWALAQRNVTLELELHCTPDHVSVITSTYGEMVSSSTCDRPSPKRSGGAAAAESRSGLAFQSGSARGSIGRRQRPRR